MLMSSSADPGFTASMSCRMVQERYQPVDRNSYGVVHEETLTVAFGSDTQAGCHGVDAVPISPREDALQQRTAIRHVAEAREDVIEGSDYVGTFGPSVVLPPASRRAGLLTTSKMVSTPVSSTILRWEFSTTAS